MAEKKKKAPKVPRQKMPEQDPLKRAKNFTEVPYGYTPELAMIEAERCLFCKKQPCIKGCPVDIDISGFVKLIAEGKFIESAQKIKEKNILPAICGRVCPQEEQCEQFCSLRKKFGSVAIGRLERFAADYEREQGKVQVPEVAPPTGKKVAIVGSGPTGLTAAFDLAKLGHKVTIFEALHAPGGVLTYGIPEFRLPKDIVYAEVDILLKMGVELKCNYVIGKIFTLEDLFDQGYDAIYLGTGAGLPYFLNIPGESLIGVYSANEFLTRVNLMRAFDFPQYDTPVLDFKKAVVFGGGNVAMDSVRTALRLGAKTATNMYRRTRNEMPARIEEIEHAEEEGVIFEYLVAPIKFIGDDKGKLKAVQGLRMELGEPDDSGRRRPVPIKGSEFETECDIAVVAIGNGANPLIQAETPELNTNKWGNILTNGPDGRTNMKGVFAGGDIVIGAATVILAMGAGREAAKSIHEYLQDGIWEKKPESTEAEKETVT
ncbi:NADPH-dependent glutamate synthase [candidate division KSB1 bacterium]